MHIPAARRVEFAAAHRLRNPRLSDARNERLYGPCAHKGGHGHNYVLEVTLRGEVNPETGMLIDLKRVKALLAPHLGASAPLAAAVADQVSSFVTGRRATIISEIKPTPPVWPFPVAPGACAATIGKVLSASSSRQRSPSNEHSSHCSAA